MSIREYKEIVISRLPSVKFIPLDGSNHFLFLIIIKNQKIDILTKYNIEKKTLKLKEIIRSLPDLSPKLASISHKTSYAEAEKLIKEEFPRGKIIKCYHKYDVYKVLDGLHCVMYFSLFDTSKEWNNERKIKTLDAILSYRKLEDMNYTYMEFVRLDAKSLSKVGKVFECPICFYEFDLDSSYQCERCKNNICITCYEKILNNSKEFRCPICRNMEN